MKIQKEAQLALAEGFASIIDQYRLPLNFPDSVVNEAEASAKSTDWQSGNRYDATDIPFVTLDPATSTDLDQAFYLDQDGSNLLLYYALADVGAFVPFGSEVEQEAWNRGLTIYGIAGKIPLYPRVISQQSASLLPDGLRPAILVVVSIDPDGNVELRQMKPIVCRSREKLAYDSVDLSRFPILEDFAQRMWKNETERGSIRVEFPQQEVVMDEAAPGGVRLELRGRVHSESVNSALSLSVNITIGNLLRDASMGLFRVMDDPDPRSIEKLRRTAEAIGIPWGELETLHDLQKRLVPTDEIHQRFLLEARRSGGRASYAVFDSKKLPWHSAIASTYVHATAPMRRLGDRYVLDLACAVANKQRIPDLLSGKIKLLPEVMQRFEGRASNVDRAVIDLIEAVSVQNRIGKILEAYVVDAQAGIVQTHDSAIRSRAMKLPPCANGKLVHVRIDEADPTKRKIRLTVVDV